MYRNVTINIIIIIIILFWNLLLHYGYENWAK